MQRLLLWAAMLALVLVITVPAMAQQQVEDPNTDEPRAEDPNTEGLTSDDPKHKKKHKKKKKGGGGVVVEGPNFDDQKARSGPIETETNISIEGDNNNQCAGLLQFDQTGNLLNQQGTLQYALPDAGDNEFAGPETSFTPENGTECEQGVEQASSASSSR